MDVSDRNIKNISFPNRKTLLFFLSGLFHVNNIKIGTRSGSVGGKPKVEKVRFILLFPSHPEEKLRGKIFSPTHRLKNVCGEWKVTESRGEYPNFFNFRKIWFLFLNDHFDYESFSLIHFLVFLNV